MSIPSLALCDHPLLGHETDSARPSDLAPEQRCHSSTQARPHF